MAIVAMVNDTKCYKVDCRCGVTLRFASTDIVRGPSTYRDEGYALYSIKCPVCSVYYKLGYERELTNLIPQLPSWS